MHYLAVQQENIELCYIMLPLQKLYILGKTPIKNLYSLKGELKIYIA